MAADCLQKATLCFFKCIASAGKETLAIALDSCQRRAQLMSDVGDEGVLEPFCLGLGGHVSQHDHGAQILAILRPNSGRVGASA